jgi:polar amino acid transport system substrate-binding protein
MKQLSQKLKDGKMQVLKVPIPSLLPGTVLVRVRYSLISAGTESSTVKAARANLLEKVRSRPQQAKQVMDTLVSQGPVQTWRAVMKKLDAYSTLGYSCVGEVINVAEGAGDFRAGDMVACGGLTASHAEVVCVPKNLCVKLRPDADLKQAAYNTVGAIAMQGVRQADLRLGETCAVIGMGLIGQLTALILRAAGVRVIGIDIDQKIIEIAAQHCLDLSLVRDDAGITAKIDEFTDGIGCDAVIITAATDSLDPVNFAGQISRKRGTVIIVGDVPTGFDRDPFYYRKELQVKMSCSYGPGRYDPTYEEKGADYPPAYVRWTENRNMQAFQELIYSKKIDVSYLTTQTFKLEDAPAAYDMLMTKSEPFIGILIEYDISKDFDRDSSKINLKLKTNNLKPERVIIGFVGAGSYAQSHLLPNIPKDGTTILKGVMTATATGARSVGERFGFEFCTGDERDIFQNDEINTVFIASRHDSHAAYVLKALSAGKHVFVEKPLCLTEPQLNEIVTLYSTLSTKHSALPLLMVGFNRRLSPLAQTVKKQLAGGPAAMHYRINAGFIPKDSWIQDIEVGGGRIVGEVCHFIDFLTYLNGSLPCSVHAAAMRSASGTSDTVTITLAFQNGSIGTVSYFANGDKSLPKERVEIFSHGVVYILDDFRSLTIHANGGRKEKKLLVQDKGQKNEVRSFLESIREGKDAVIPFREIHSATLVTLKALESLRTGGCVTVSLD